MNDVSDDQESVRKSLRDLAARIERAHSARQGEIVLRLSGRGAGTFRVRSAGGRAEVMESLDAPGQPLIEVLGDAETVRKVLDGTLDARTQFLQGGLRVRGDLQYLSDLAMELGLIKQPL